MRFLCLITVTFLTGLAFAANEKVPLDPTTGMKMGVDWEIVRNHCIACHSPQTILRQRATEADWTSTLEWMQTNGDLWKLDPAVQKTIVKDLDTHFGPGESGTYRRPPIPATLMPPNPHATDARLEAEAKKQEGLRSRPPAPR